MDLFCVQDRCHIETGKTSPQTVGTKLEAHCVSLYALDFPSGTKGPCPNHKKHILINLHT